MQRLNTYRWFVARSGTVAFILTILAVLIAGCAPRPAGQPAAGEALKVIATTSIVGDVVRQVGGESIELTVLLPLGADPHSFEPTPQDVSAISEADVVFANGAGLEVFLDPLLENAGAADKVIRVSDGIVLLEGTGEHEGEEHAEEGEGEPHEGEEEHQEGEEHGHAGGDPHTWTDPINVLLWVDNIAAALSQLDPENADTYRENASQYKESLEELDAWIRAELEQVPEENRLLVTDHQIFAYFAARYGFEQVGAIVPGYSTMAEPSAQDLARLEDAIQALGVKAIFVGNTVNPSLAERVAEDTGTALVFLYSDSLSEPGGEAGNYLDFMRYNVSAISEALR